MQVGRRLKDTFLARDAQGHEYEVKVYVHTSRGPAASGGGPAAEHVSATEASVLTGPLAGETFNVTPIDGDVYQVHITGSDPKIIRVR
jgi:hypothetical protein